MRYFVEPIRGERLRHCRDHMIGGPVVWRRDQRSPSQFRRCKPISEPADRSESGTAPGAAPNADLPIALSGKASGYPLSGSGSPSIPRATLARTKSVRCSGSVSNLWFDGALHVAMLNSDCAEPSRASVRWTIHSADSPDATRIASSEGRSSPRAGQPVPFVASTSVTVAECRCRSRRRDLAVPC